MPFFILPAISLFTCCVCWYVRTYMYNGVSLFHYCAGVDFVYCTNLWGTVLVTTESEFSYHY